MLARKSNVFFIFILVSTVLVGIMFVHAAVMQRIDLPALHEQRDIVGVLELSDLCIFTEARYTRHPSMADFNTPFQDYPMSFEHFPSGSMVTVPPHLAAPAQK